MVRSGQSATVSAQHQAGFYLRDRVHGKAKIEPTLQCAYFWKKWLDSLGYFVGTDATSADICTLRATIGYDSYALNVRKNNPLRFIVSVADVIADRLLFATYLTGCHTSPPFPTSELHQNRHL